MDIRKQIGYNRDDESDEWLRLCKSLISDIWEYRKNIIVVLSGGIKRDDNHRDHDMSMRDGDASIVNLSILTKKGYHFTVACSILIYKLTYQLIQKSISNCDD